MKIALIWLWEHRTKTIGFISVVLGVLATSSAIPEGWLKYFVLANGVVTAAVGYFNSSQNYPSGKEPPP